MGLFGRLFRIGSAEANAMVDKLEDPVKMTEQGIRDLKTDLQEALKSFAEVKAITIRAQRSMEKSQLESKEWERKAMALLQQGQSGAMEGPKAERLATEALSRKESSDKRYIAEKQAYDQQNQNVMGLQGNIEKLKSNIGQYENELVTLKARAKTAQATGKINKQISAIDSSGTVSLLERMKSKVEEEETLAIAYGDIAQASSSVDDEINQALLPDAGSPASESDALAALKAKMGIENKG